jgi:ABC-2 type transport system permease protein
MTTATFPLGLHQGRLEIKQFLRSREAVVFTLLFPILLLVIFAAIFTFEIAPGLRFSQYFIAGMIAAGLLSVGFQSLAIQIPIERDRGVLKRLRGTPMPKAAYFIGKIVMVLAVGVVETVLLLAVTACTLCGIAFSSVVRTARSAPAVVTPVALVLQFMSGVFFVYTDLPELMQRIAAVFPLKWMCQGMRSVFLPDSFAAQEAAGSWELGRVAMVLTAWCVGGLILCLLTFRWTTKRDG